jgi:hypothetical protein
MQLIPCNTLRVLCSRELKLLWVRKLLGNPGILILITVPDITDLSKILFAEYETERWIHGRSI